MLEILRALVPEVEELASVAVVARHLHELVLRQPAVAVGVHADLRTASAPPCCAAAWTSLLLVCRRIGVCMDGVYYEMNMLNTFLPFQNANL